VAKRDEASRRPTDYQQVLTDPINDEQPLIVGGQAVNLWALAFLNSEPELERFQPFTSKDCDVVASKNWIYQIAEKYGLEAHTVRAGQASPAVGFIVIPLAKKETTEVQVLRAVAGLSNKELRESTSRVDFNGKVYRVIDPIALLKAKLNNVRYFDQKDRNDIQHVHTLC
jgi:hypothetical protein